MPDLDVNGTGLHYSDTGSGKETIVFSHGLLFSGLMFEDQIEQFKSRYRCVSYDHRGHGGSAVARDGYDIDTSADPEPRENLPRYRMLTFIARWFGIALVVGNVMPIMFGQRFLNDPARSPEREMWRRRIASNDRVGVTRAVRGVIERAGVSGEIRRIDTPTLIIVGENDAATVPEKSDRMHSAIAGSRLVRIPHAGHSSTIEEPRAVNAAMSGFLAGLGD